MASTSGKSSWLKSHAVLLLLLVCYLLTSSIIVEQQRTIESQRVLIRSLFHDSMELTNLKIKEARAKR
jgi:hypothetical protein